MTLKEYCRAMSAAVEGLDEQGRVEWEELHGDGLLGILEALGHCNIDPDSTDIGALMRESRRLLEMMDDEGLLDGFVGSIFGGPLTTCDL
jgi:hypothetical protein